MLVFKIHKYLQFVYIFIFSNLKNYEKYIQIKKLNLKNNYIYNKLSFYGEYILRRYIVFIDKIVNLKSMNNSFLTKKSKKSLTTLVMKYVYLWVLLKKLRHIFCKNYLLTKLQDKKIKIYSSSLFNKVYPYVIVIYFLHQLLSTFYLSEKHISNKIVHQIYDKNLNKSFKISKSALIWSYLKKLNYCLLIFLKLLNIFMFSKSYYLKSTKVKLTLFKNKKMLNLDF